MIPIGELAPWVIEEEVPEPSKPPYVDRWGADVLAFYKPFHFYEWDWGIYVLASGVLYLATVIKGARLTIGDEPMLNLAEVLLREHVAFHFAAEVACSRAEVVAKKRLYSDYFRHPYASPHEEALANAQAFTRTAVSQPSPIQSRIETWMKGQAVGYRDFAKWLRSSSFSEGSLRAARFMNEPLPPPGAMSGPADFLFGGVRRYSVQTFWLTDIIHGGAGRLRPFPKAFGMQVFTNSNDHRPPHIHIERPPGGRETRYLWPELTPYKGDQRLPAAGEEDLQRYIDRYGHEIDNRIQRIYGAH